MSFERIYLKFFNAFDSNIWPHSTRISFFKNVFILFNNIITNIEIFEKIKFIMIK